MSFSSLSDNKYFHKWKKNYDFLNEISKEIHETIRV